ncbi:Putative restriction endonuclease [Kitasatospora sp. MMS16-BH015]|uniref:restriction endonuclease n=1 Tax=Kitasatospora sp. MMS16-BH015 TaxID=2018025 RepID=UPI000CA0AEC4|nr:restriction endonuclease [Kitasatospora sp. MMS16-BH015]AUG80113.1 Putative restriction endonuclease [Kitasatospora sp. MMS16-BH015]
MARRRSSGVLGMVAEAQRQQRLRQEEQRRAALAAQRQHERQQRDAQRAAAQGEKEALRAYQQGREADAARRTAEVEARVAELRAVLATGLSGGPDVVPPFDPGPLGVPVPMPDQSWYQVPPPPPGGERQYHEQLAHARARFEYDWRAAQDADQQRLTQLAQYRAEFDAWAVEHRRLAAERTARAAELAASGATDTAAVVELFEGALRWRTDWPEGFPTDGVVAWDAAARQLVVDWLLPEPEIVPPVARVRYVKTDDREAEVARSAAERRSLYRELLAQSALRVLAELFRADTGKLLSSVVFNGCVEALNPATGREELRCLVSVTVERSAFLAVELPRVEPVSCLVDGLRGRLSSRPERLEEVKTERLAEQVGSYLPPGDEDPDLYTMDPLEFEELIAELFRRRGYSTRTTARSGDQGVDVVAEDPDPITGGLIVIQAKRYRHRVDPTAVRDLDATRVHHGANRGILVTTATFGPDSHRWVEGKPLALVDGPTLIGLLREHGLPGHLGPAVPPPPPAELLPVAAAPTLTALALPAVAATPTPTLVDLPVRPAAPPTVPLMPGQNVALPAGEGAVTVRFDFDPSGADADLTLLLLGADGLVDSDADFVFYHQREAEHGTVTLHPKETGSETATLAPARLPARVRRIAVSVNIDTDSGLTCADLRAAALTVRAADGSSWSFTPPADPGISAMLVAELYRHQPPGAPELWKLRAIGQGWSDGLAGLARAHGVDVA